MIIIDDNKENKVLINSTKQWLKSTPNNILPEWYYLLFLFHFIKFSSAFWFR